jgi:hypothetical protein
MSGQDTPCLVAVADRSWEPILMAAGRQLADAVAHAIGGDWSVNLRFLADADGPLPQGDWIVVSLNADVAGDAPMAMLECRWHERLERYAASYRRVLVCNSFRGVNDPAMIERLRQISMMAIRLSRGTGAEIADVDRLLALVGGRTARCDWRLAGETAAQLAAHVIVATLLDGELASIPDDVQMRAARFHGGLRDIPAIAKRRVGKTGAG